MNTMNTMMQRALVLMLAYITVPSAAASERNMRNMRIMRIILTLAAHHTRLI